jgi:hypothetical protein
MLEFRKRKEGRGKRMCVSISIYIRTYGWGTF